MAKRAVIYVRTSSEYQGEKCSPVEQELDCRRFAETQGFVVVNVYRDIERYRVKNKWVGPSGTRYDRPGLLAMLRDAADNQFDVIINRQWVITRARKGAISEVEMEQKLTSMSVREVELKKQLAAIQEAIDARLLIDWEAKVRQYFVDLQEGIQGLNHMPDTPDEQLYVCELKRQIIETLVEKIDVDRNQQFTVTIRLHILGILEESIGNKGGAASGGHWPTMGGGKQAQSSGKTSSFRPGKGHIRVSAIWTM